MKIVVKNPCRYCLTKPACVRKCDDLEQHIELYEILSIIAVFVFSILLTVSIPIIGYKCGYKAISLIGISLYYLGMYGWMFHEHKQNPSDLNEMDRWERWSIIFLFPHVILIVPLVAWIVEKLRFQDFFFRYHQTINPHREG